jgi:hypothetical protein
LPSAVLRAKKADCKSLSLLLSAMLTRAKITNGLRFVAYGTPNFTHVYNYIYNVDGTKLAIDICMPNLIESPNATKIKDMKVQYIAGAPIMIDDSDFIGRRRGRQQRQQARQERREDRQQTRQTKRQERKDGTRPSAVKKIALAPARAAFLGLTRLNFRKLATRLFDLSNKNNQKFKTFWLKLGGDPNKLLAAVNAGRVKRPLLGMPAVGATGAELLAAALPIILAASKLLKSENVEAEDLAEISATAQPLGEFEATDAETPEAQKVTQLQPGSNGGSSGGALSNIPIVPILIGGAALAILLFAGKKKK